MSPTAKSPGTAHACPLRPARRRHGSVVAHLRDRGGRRAQANSPPAPTTMCSPPTSRRAHRLLLQPHRHARRISRLPRHRSHRDEPGRIRHPLHRLQPRPRQRTRPSLPDGRIAFSRLELFYSRLKTELTVQTILPDGTMNRTLYGPEETPELWRRTSPEVVRREGLGRGPPRHRVLRLTQPQPLDNQRVVVSAPARVDPYRRRPGALTERFLPRQAKHDVAVTTPFPLDDRRILCAASNRRTTRRTKVDLGLYTA